MGILDYFRRKKYKPQTRQPTTEIDLRKDLKDDPYNGKILAAIKLSDNGKGEKAETLLRQIIKEKEEHVRTWFVLAEHFVKTNQLGRALYCFEKIIKYQPTNQMARNQISELSKVVRGRPDYLWEYNQERGVI